MKDPETAPGADAVDGVTRYEPTQPIAAVLPGVDHEDKTEWRVAARIGTALYVVHHRDQVGVRFGLIAPGNPSVYHLQRASDLDAYLAAIGATTVRKDGRPPDRWWRTRLPWYGYMVLCLIVMVAVVLWAAWYLRRLYDTGQGS